MSIDIGILPTDLAQFVEDEVRSGHYSSTNHVVQSAIGLLRERTAKLTELRRLIAEADAEYERGEYIEIKNQEEHNAFFDELKAELEQFIAQEQR